MGASTRMADAGILASLKHPDNRRANYATAVHPNIRRKQRRCSHSTGHRDLG